MTINTNYKIWSAKIASFMISEERKIATGQLCGQRKRT